MSTLLKKIAVATLIVSIAPAIATAKVSSLLDYVTGNMNQQQNQFCAGYIKGKTCDDVIEKTETCPQSYKYKKCISRSPKEICLKLGFKENPKCDDDEELEVCNYKGKTYNGFGKCVPLSSEEICKQEDKDFIKNPNCTAYQDKIECKHDSNYGKCVDITYDVWCKDHGYTNTSCTGIYEVDEKCPHPKRPSNQSELMTCKLKSASEMCPGYSPRPGCDLTWQVEVACTVDGYSNYKKCEPSADAKRCKNNGYTRPKPACLSDQKLEDCPFLSDVFAKCVDKTDAEKCLDAGYIFNPTCSQFETYDLCRYDNSYAKCQLTDYDTWCRNNGYTYEENCPNGMNIIGNCPHPVKPEGQSTLVKCEGKTVAQQCADEGYETPKLTICPTDQKLEDCPYSPTTHNKCVNMTAAEKCARDGYQMGITTCPTDQRLENCPYWSAYKKCVNITPAEKCVQEGYQTGITSCPAGKLKDCPYLATYKKCVPAEVITCVEGAVLYEDLKCYDALPANKDAIGVVFDTTSKLAVSLTQANKKFGPNQDYQSLTNFLNSEVNKDKVKQEDGKTNTDKIVKTEGQTSISYAAGYCYSLAPEGKWYLPGYSELKKIRDKFDNINAYLESAGGTPFGDGQTAQGVYWLPVEGNINTSAKIYLAWTYAPSPKLVEGPNLDDKDKDESPFARCVISYDSN